MDVKTHNPTEKYIRFLPRTGSDVFNDDEFWALPLDWLLNLRLTQKDFVLNETKSFYVAKVKTPNNKILDFKSDVVEYRRVFELFKNRSPIPEGNMWVNSDSRLDLTSLNDCPVNTVRLMAFGENYKEANYQNHLRKIKKLLEGSFERARLIAGYASEWAGIPMLEQSEINHRKSVLLYHYTLEQIFNKLKISDIKHSDFKLLEKLHLKNSEKFKEKLLDIAIKNCIFNDVFKQCESVYIMVEHVEI